MKPQVQAMAGFAARRTRALADISNQNPVQNVGDYKKKVRGFFEFLNL